MTLQPALIEYFQDILLVFGIKNEIINFKTWLTLFIKGNNQINYYHAINKRQKTYELCDIMCDTFCNSYF